MIPGEKERRLLTIVAFVVRVIEAVIKLLEDI